PDPVIDLSQGSVISIGQMSCLKLSFFSDIYYYRLGGVFFRKLLRRDPVHLIRFFTGFFPGLKSSVQISQYMIKTHPAQTGYRFFLRSRIRYQNDWLLYIYNHSPDPGSEITFQPYVDGTGDE